MIVMLLRGPDTDTRPSTIIINRDHLQLTGHNSALAVIQYSSTVPWYSSTRVRCTMVLSRVVQPHCDCPLQSVSAAAR